jgi:NitT/TauT family transport system substrate-binding protein
LVKRPAFLAASAALVAFPSRVRSQGLTKIRIGASANADSIGSLWGIQSGIFQRSGLDVEVVRMNNGASVSAAVIGGSLEMGKGSLFVLIGAHSKGVPILLEGASNVYHADQPDSALIVSKNSPVRSPRELNGKTIAVPSLGDFYAVVILAWIDQRGGDSKTLKVLELPNVATAAAIVDGRIDAAILAEPLLSDSVQSGKCRILGYPHEALGPRSISTAYFCTTAFAQQNVAAMTRFRKGLDEASAYVNAHPAEMMPIIGKYTGIDMKTVASMAPNSIGTTAQLLDPKLIQPTIDFAQRYKAIPKAFPAREMVDPNAIA